MPVLTMRPISPREPKMKVGGFNTAPLRHNQLFRDAKMAMLTHRVLFHLALIVDSVNEIEEALDEFTEAIEPARDSWTIGM